MILSKTGMELEALGKVTWRNVYPEAVHWRPSRTNRVAVIPLTDESLAHAFRLFATGQRKAPSLLSYWIEQCVREAGTPGVAHVTALTLRLTHCYKLLLAGVEPEDICAETRLTRTSIQSVADQMAAAGLPPARAEDVRPPL